MFGTRNWILSVIPDIYSVYITSCDEEVECNYNDHNKIYMADFNPSYGILVSFIRVEDPGKHLFRIWKDLSGDICVSKISSYERSYGDLERYRVEGQWERFIYVSLLYAESPASERKNAKRAIIFEEHSGNAVCVRDYSKYIYCSICKYVIIFNTVAMDFLPPVRILIEGVRKIVEINRISDNELAVLVEMDDGSEHMLTELAFPEGYQKQHKIPDHVNTQPLKTVYLPIEPPRSEKGIWKRVIHYLPESIYRLLKLFLLIIFYIVVDYIEKKLTVDVVSTTNNLTTLICEISESTNVEYSWKDIWESIEEIYDMLVSIIVLNFAFFNFCETRSIIEGNANTVLVISKEEILPRSTDIFQTNDGTIYYWEFRFWTDRLYVIFKGEEVEASLPSKKINHVFANANAIYFIAGLKVFKAVFYPPDRINVSYLRDLMQGESLQYWNPGMSGYTRGNTHYIHRLCDDPADGLAVHLSKEEGEYLNIIGMHRIITICSIERETQDLVIRHLGENTIVVEGSGIEVLAEDASPIIYITEWKGRKISIFNTSTMGEISTLKFGDEVVYVDHIAGIHNGYITAKVRIGNNLCLITAKLPKEYHTMSLQILRRNQSKKTSGSIDRRLNNETFESEFIMDFEIQGVIGTGGFGCVFKAKQKFDNCEFAVKRIHVSGRFEEISKTLKEATALVIMSTKHEGIVEFESCWVEKPPPGWQRWKDIEIKSNLGYQEKFPQYANDCVFMYIVMELCTSSLKDRLKMKDRDVCQASAWFEQLVSALAFIHKHGKIHRDLKPSNILLDGRDRIKICDFGVVTNRVFDTIICEEIDVTRSDVGTPMYAAPEQMSAIGGKPTAKSDVFSLGLILIELFVYMDEAKTNQVFRDYRNGSSKNILEKSSLEEVDAVSKWLTNPDPSQRPSCEQLLELRFTNSKHHVYEDGTWKVIIWSNFFVCQCIRQGIAPNQWYSH